MTLSPFGHWVPGQRTSSFAAAMFAIATIASFTPVTEARAQQDETPPPGDTVAPPPDAAQAQPVVVPPHRTAHRLRPTIAVLGIGGLDGAGHTSALNGSAVDETTRALAEEAITNSNAFRLYSRDLMAQQAKEINTDAEGFVDPESAQRFGKSVGIQYFLTVFVSSGSAKRFVGENVSEFSVPSNGTVVTGPLTEISGVTGSASDVSGVLGLLGSNSQKNKNSPPSRRALVQGAVTIMCRFTRVSTGQRTTESFSGMATADASHADERLVAAAALKDAFDNFRNNLWQHRQLLIANITEIAEGKAIVDIGAADGIASNMAFEVCERKKVGTFVTFTHVCDARVAETNPSGSLLEFGEYKKQFLQDKPSFHKDDSKASGVRPGYIIREKRI